MNTTIDNEITLEVSVRKEYFISIIMHVILFAIYICFDIILTTADRHNPLLSNFFMLIFFMFGYKYQSWRLHGRRIITFDEKYLIISDIHYKKRRSKVYKIADIYDLTVDTGYKLTLWKRIKSFWTLDNGGCIGFYYKTEIHGKPEPVFVGYGLVPADAINMLSAAKEKGLIQNYGKDLSIKPEYMYLNYIAAIIGVVIVLTVAIFLFHLKIISGLTHNEMLIGFFGLLILISLLFIYMRKKFK
jgi:hypothetical protein